MHIVANEDQKNEKILLGHPKTAKINKHSAKIKVHHLEIDGNLYTAEELKTQIDKKHEVKETRRRKRNETEERKLKEEERKEGGILVEEELEELEEGRVEKEKECNGNNIDR
ncbi:hypothetical protein JTB14_034218 [Gonioctena quinquepunctata]|nr:hypothetical protein JTB14_034218 [Gonioctena quinquepunctata]